MNLILWLSGLSFILIGFFWLYKRLDPRVKLPDNEFNLVMGVMIVSFAMLTFLVGTN